VIVYTIGHSTRGINEFVALLERSRIERLIDVRAFPGSRRHPHFNREALARALPTRGIEYLHRPALGGRRRPRPDAPPSAWRNESFRGYADYMRTPEFHRALDELIALAAERRTAIMCSEAVPWRCHRTLIADALTARGGDVEHILDAKTSPHVLTSFAVVGDGEVTYPPIPEADASREQHALALDDS
jgi:uncharacterized protein (DUF488 family)